MRVIIAAFLLLLAWPVYAQESADMPRHDSQDQPVDNGGALPQQVPENQPQDGNNKDNFQVDEDESPDSATPEEKPEPAAKPAKQLAVPAVPAPLPPAATGPVTGFEMAPQKNYADIVILQALNKITARASELVVPVGSSIRFGNLEITARLCWKSSPEDTPDSKALLEIDEQKPDEEKKKIFYGWMLASSPALSSLEHPVYDITVINCRFKPSAPVAPVPAPVPVPVKKKP